MPCQLLLKLHMTWQGCFGVRIDEIDKLTFCGSDASIKGLGWRIIKNTNRIIKILGYECSLKLWRKQAQVLNMVSDTDCQLEQRNIQTVLSKGKAYNAKHLMFDSYLCQWAYILDLDNENFEIYVGYQKKTHKNGRYAGRKNKGANFYPCTLLTCIRLTDLEEFHPDTYIIEEDFLINIGWVLR